MYADVPFSTIGPEGMGFIGGGFTMYHSVGPAKAWRKKFLRSTLEGLPPSNGDKHFLAVRRWAALPVLSASNCTASALRAACAAFLGAFIAEARSGNAVETNSTGKIRGRKCASKNWTG